MNKRYWKLSERVFFTFGGGSQQPVPLSHCFDSFLTVIPPHVAAPTAAAAAAAAETTTTADFVYADFNSTHGLTFAGASGTTACANVTELEYGDVQGDADQLQGSLGEAMREAGEEVVTTDARTSQIGEHDEITALHVRASHQSACAF